MIELDIRNALKKAALKEKIEYINLISENYEGYNTVIAGLIPYYAGECDSYFSKYTRGMDYHKVGRRIFGNILSDLGISDYKIYVDISPYNERELALRCGLGVKGRNGLLINEKYGSYVFIAIALVNTDDVYENAPLKECIGCGECMKKCPTGALGGESICYEKCISQITQKRSITSAEEDIIRKNKTAWGCDCCQDVCPYNKKVSKTPILEFKERLLTHMNDLNTISNREFKEKYGCYALAYKGRNILKRNINLLNNNS